MGPAHHAGGFGECPSGFALGPGPNCEINNWRAFDSATPSISSTRPSWSLAAWVTIPPVSTLTIRLLMVVTLPS